MFSAQVYWDYNYKKKNCKTHLYLYISFAHTSGIFCSGSLSSETTDLIMAISRPAFCLKSSCPCSISFRDGLNTWLFSLTMGIATQSCRSFMGFALHGSGEVWLEYSLIHLIVAHRDLVTWKPRVLNVESILVIFKLKIYNDHSREINDSSIFSN